ncbi:MAG: hypothetical protein QM689_10575 [Oscillospiraceae bacterium]
MPIGLNSISADAANEKAGFYFRINDDTGTFKYTEGICSGTYNESNYIFYAQTTPDTDQAQIIRYRLDNYGNPIYSGNSEKSSKKTTLFSYGKLGAANDLTYNPNTNQLYVPTLTNIDDAGHPYIAVLDNAVSTDSMTIGDNYYTVYDLAHHASVTSPFSGITYLERLNGTDYVILSIKKTDKVSGLVSIYYYVARINNVTKRFVINSNTCSCSILLNNSSVKSQGTCYYDGYIYSTYVNVIEGTKTTVSGTSSYIVKSAVTFGDITDPYSMKINKISEETRYTSKISASNILNYSSSISCTIMEIEGITYVPGLSTDWDGSFYFSFNISDSSGNRNDCIKYATYQ